MPFAFAYGVKDFSFQLVGVRLGIEHRYTGQSTHDGIENRQNDRDRIAKNSDPPQQWQNPYDQPFPTIFRPGIGNRDAEYEYECQGDGEGRDCRKP